ncbi:MAG: hypothetical protein HC906_08805 [Bacteroidales bacterium]|nr:hypothetical protein [Bacteroidales bacterium]
MIHYSYEGQVDFTPAVFASSFDGEALTATNDTVYVFSKDWLNLHSSVYSIPAKPGTYTAKKIRQIKSEGLVTGADVKNDTLVLCGYNLFNPFLLIIPDEKKPEIAIRLELQDLSGVQIEGVAIVNKHEFLITNEKSSVIQSLQRIRIQQ